MISLSFKPPSPPPFLLLTNLIDQSRLKPFFELQGGKTFCASFCASLTAGSRRAFLCVDCVCLLLAGVLSEMHEVRTFAPCKAFLFDMFAFFRSLKITLDSEQPMLKEKMDHSVSLRWNKEF